MGQIFASFQKVEYEKEGEKKGKDKEKGIYSIPSWAIIEERRHANDDWRVFLKWQN